MNQQPVPTFHHLQYIVTHEVADDPEGNSLTFLSGSDIVAGYPSIAPLLQNDDSGEASTIRIERDVYRMLINPLLDEDCNVVHEAPEGEVCQECAPRPTVVVAEVDPFDLPF